MRTSAAAEHLLASTCDPCPILVPDEHRLHAPEQRWRRRRRGHAYGVAQAVFGAGRINYQRIVGAILLYLLIAVTFTGSAWANGHRHLIARLAAQHKLTAVVQRLYVEAGGLISYGPNFYDQRAAAYVDRSSRGRSRPTYRCRRPPITSLSSTSRPPGSAMSFPLGYRSAGSNERHNLRQYMTRARRMWNSASALRSRGGFARGICTLSTCRGFRVKTQPPLTLR